MCYGQEEAAQKLHKSSFIIIYLSANVILFYSSSLGVTIYLYS